MPTNRDDKSNLITMMTAVITAATTTTLTTRKAVYSGPLCPNPSQFVARWSMVPRCRETRFGDRGVMPLRWSAPANLSNQVMKGAAMRGLQRHTRCCTAQNKCIVDSTGTERKWKEEKLLVYMAAAARWPINFVIAYTVVSGLWRRWNCFIDPDR